MTDQPMTTNVSQPHPDAGRVFADGQLRQLMCSWCETTSILEQTERALAFAQNLRPTGPQTVYQAEQERAMQAELQRRVTQLTREVAALGLQIRTGLLQRAIGNGRG